MTDLWPPDRGKVRGVGPISRKMLDIAGMRRSVSNYFLSLLDGSYGENEGGKYTMVAAIQPEEKASK